MSQLMLHASERGALPSRGSRWPRIPVALAALITAGGFAWALDDTGQANPAGAPCEGEEKCPVAKKVSTLLVGWKAAAAEVKNVPEADQAKLKTELAGCAKECPVGSRLGETLGFVKAVLASTIELEAACKKQCPIESSGDEAAKDLKKARSRLITGLDELAGYAAGTCSGACTKATGAETASLSDRALVLLASWDKAPAQIAAMPAEKKLLLATKISAFAERCKAVKMVPATVEGLSAGFNTIDAMNGKLEEWVKAHPDLFKDAPPGAADRMASHLALLHATARILERTHAAMKELGAECRGGTAETASSK